MSAIRNKANAGAITGAVIEGLSFLGIVAGLIVFIVMILCRRNLSAPPNSNGF